MPVAAVLISMPVAAVITSIPPESHLVSNECSPCHVSPCALRATKLLPVIDEALISVEMRFHIYSATHNGNLFRFAFHTVTHHLVEKLSSHFVRSRFELGRL